MRVVREIENMAQTLDDTFHALAHPYRRRLLTALAEHDLQADDTLHVLEDVPIENTQRTELRTELYHTHIPKLEEAGLIHRARDANQVMKGPQFDEIRPVLKLLTDDPDELSLYA